MILYCNLTWSALHLETCSYSTSSRGNCKSAKSHAWARADQSTYAITCLFSFAALLAWRCRAEPKDRTCPWCPDPVNSVHSLIFASIFLLCISLNLLLKITPCTMSRVESRDEYYTRVNPLQIRPRLLPYSMQSCWWLKTNQPKIYILQTCKVLQLKEKSNGVILQVTKQIFKPEEFFRSFSCTVDSVEVKMSVLLFSKR